MTLGMMIAMPLLLGFWFPSMTPVDERTIAARIREVSPTGPYCFYSEMHLPLVFYLQTPVPSVANSQKLETVLDKSPQTLIIVGGKENEPKETIVRPPADVGKWKLIKDAQVRAPPPLFLMYRAQAK
jgi:hypothetical protein